MEPSTARIRVRVAPGASSSEVVGRYADGWKLRVAAAPERGRATHEVVALLAGLLGVPRRSVRVVAGLTSRDKVVEIAGLTNEHVDGVLAGREAP